MTQKAMGNFEAAIGSYNCAILINPKNPEPHQNLGVVLMKLGRIPESLDSFKTAIGLYETTDSPEGDRLVRSLAELGFEL